MNFEQKQPRSLREIELAVEVEGRGRTRRNSSASSRPHVRSRSAAISPRRRSEFVFKKVNSFFVKSDTPAVSSFHSSQALIWLGSLVSTNCCAPEGHLRGWHRQDDQLRHVGDNDDLDWHPDRVSQVACLLDFDA